MASDFTKLYKRWSTGTPRKEDMKFICTKRTYTKDLSVDMDTILSDVDSFLGFAPFIPSDIHEKLTVYLDDTEERTITVSKAHLRKVLALYEKELMSLEQENAQNSEEIEKLRSLINSIKSLIAGASGSSVTITTSILGHYKRAGLDGKPEISLMMRALEGEPELAAIVYVHELMHAYYDMHNIEHPYIPEIEEPLAEYGMLCFMEMFQRAHPEYEELFDNALKHVENKKYSLGICHYGYGAFLFKDKSNFCVDWVTLFHSICIALSETSDDAKVYRKMTSPIMYPREERECEVWLYNALTPKCFYTNKIDWQTQDRLFVYLNKKYGDIEHYKVKYPSKNIVVAFDDKPGESCIRIYATTHSNYIYINKLSQSIFESKYGRASHNFVFFEKDSADRETTAEWIAKEL